MKKLHEIFDKDDFLQLLQDEKVDPKIINALHYLAEHHEDLISVVVDLMEKIETLKWQLLKHEHKHGKVWIELGK